LIDLSIPLFVSIENDIAQLCIKNGELYLTIIDDSVPCFNENVNYYSVLYETAEWSLQNEENYDEDDDDVQPVKITIRKAEKCINQLRLYFTQNWNENVPSTSLDVCADCIIKQSLNKLQQKRRNDFMQPIKVGIKYVNQLIYNKYVCNKTNN